ncbi:MAG: CBS domain-containing protein [Promethearchaeota archaeon]
MSIPVTRIMTKSVIYFSLPGNREQIRETMQKSKKTTFPVVDENKKVVGIISHSDLFTKPKENQLSLLMARNPKTIKSDRTVLECAEAMYEHELSRLPVIDENSNELIGIVSISDIVSKVLITKKYAEASIAAYKEHIATIWKETPADVAQNILRLSGQKALPVLDHMGLVGIVSMNDLFKLVKVRESSSQSSTGGGEGESGSWDSETVFVVVDRELVLPSIPISEVIVSKERMQVAYKHNTLQELAQKCRKCSIDQLPLISSEGRLMGLITNRDLLRSFIIYEREKEEVKESFT